MNLLPYIQIVLSVLLVILILIQHSDASSGGAFGQGDNWSAAFHTRRGPEKFIFYFTIIISAIFFASCIYALLLK